MSLAVWVRYDDAGARVSIVVDGKRLENFTLDQDSQGQFASSILALPKQLAHIVEDTHE